MTKRNDMTNASKKDEALKLALEDLLLVWKYRPSITALREALAEQPAPVAEPHKQQEPVIECDCETATSPDGSRLTKCGSDQMRRAVEDGHAFCKQPAQQEPKKDLMYSTVAMQERHAAFVDRAVATLEQAKREALAEQPAPATELRGQEPVAVPTTSYEHRKFVLVGRDWYERFAAFHDDCQIGEQLTWQEKTIRQQGYENGWNDAQRYLKEPQSTSPTPAQRTWVGLTDVEIASACKKNGGAEWWWRDIEEYGRAIEAKLREKNT